MIFRKVKELENVGMSRFEVGCEGARTYVVLGRRNGQCHCAHATLERQFSVVANYLISYDIILAGHLSLSKDMDEGYDGDGTSHERTKFRQFFDHLRDVFLGFIV